MSYADTLNIFNLKYQPNKNNPLGSALLLSQQAWLHRFTLSSNFAPRVSQVKGVPAAEARWGLFNFADVSIQRAGANLASDSPKGPPELPGLARSHSQGPCLAERHRSVRAVACAPWIPCHLVMFVLVALVASAVMVFPSRPNQLDLPLHLLPGPTSKTRSRQWQT